MKKTNAQSVGEIIDSFLKHENLDNKLGEQQALALWPEIVGPGINRYTTNRYVNKGVLYITLSSAPLRNELMYNRSLLIKRINESLGHDVITEIVFR